MTEALYFALVAYTDQLNADLISRNGEEVKPSDMFTPTGVNTKIIIGELPTIPQTCIEKGKELAAQAEEKRKSESQKKKKTTEDLHEEFFGGISSF